ncbi:hypothetical protein PFISCL1PPCAC_24274 [Pristionchus fissidentatus]|uniref:MYND-type domain-containing protein n=1 Tax=Pristionchus fissidentatus TaxID=1538716 RepID=A0AAV5WLX5_9BILA|nr:hypothetical protein PFISCL1PPCAC_24274 [Pristionchus fissidentatus]
MKEYATQPRRIENLNILVQYASPIRYTPIRHTNTVQSLPISFSTVYFNLRMSTIVEEEPYAAAVSGAHLKNVCSNCFLRNDEKPLQRCSRCKVVSYCSSSCQKKDWGIHKDECVFLVSVSPNIPRSTARLMARLLIRKHRGDDVSVKGFNGRCFDDLMHHSDEIQSSGEHLELFSSLVHGLKQYITEEFMVEPTELLRCFGRMTINCFGITGDDQITVGEGVYLGLSVLDHSCAPDAFVRFRGRTAILRSPVVGQKFGNELTIPYTNLDTLSSERRSALERQYFFKCTCKVCMNTERDGYARSLQCDICMKGVCLVLDSSTVLTCVTCGAVNPTPVDEAMRMSQHIEWQLEKQKDNKNDVVRNLYSDVALFKKYSVILSRFNLPLAALAYRIVNLALSLDRRDIAQSHAFFYLDAYKRYLPVGHPLLTYCFLTASMAASFEQPESIRVLSLLEETRQACLLSHGPRDPECVNVDRQVSLYRTRLHNICPDFPA